MEFSPGIYFGLPEADYHSVFALSSSGMKWLRCSTYDFWVRSPLNPNLAQVLEEEPETVAKSLGSAFHARLLEGPRVFCERYAPQISKADHPGALDTNDEMKAWLRARELKLSGNKSELIERILAADPTARIWDAIEDGYRKEHEGMEFLEPRAIEKIEIAARMIEGKPDLKDTFRDGMPEVSVFFICQHTGVPCKLRIDYLKPRQIGELKSFSNLQQRDIGEAIVREFANRRYALQAAWYLDAMPYMKALIKAGMIHGDVSPDFLKAILAHPPTHVKYVFIQKGVAPVARGKIFEPMAGSTEMNTYAIAKARNDTMKQVFKECLDTYGEEMPWIDTVPTSTFLDEEIPDYATG